MYILNNFSVMNFGSLMFGKGNNFEMSMYYIIIGSNAGCGTIRVIVILIHQQEVKEVINQVNRNFSKPMQSVTRQVRHSNYFFLNHNFVQEQAKKKIGILNFIFYANVSTQLTMALVLNILSPAILHKELHPLSLPGDRTKPIYYVSLSVFGYFTGGLYAFG